jgi:hypothetical protein
MFLTKTTTKTLLRIVYWLIAILRLDKYKTSFSSSYKETLVHCKAASTRIKEMKKSLFTLRNATSMKPSLIKAPKNNKGWGHSRTSYTDTEIRKGKRLQEKVTTDIKFKGFGLWCSALLLLPMFPLGIQNDNPIIDSMQMSLVTDRLMSLQRHAHSWSPS